MHKQEQQNVLYIWFYVNYVCVCVVLGSTQKKFKEKVEKNGGRVISMPKENLPQLSSVFRRWGQKWLLKAK